MIDMGLLGFYSRSSLGKMKIKHSVVTEEISWNAGVDLWGAARRLYHIYLGCQAHLCSYFFS